VSKFDYLRSKENSIFSIVQGATEDLKILFKTQARQVNLGVSEILFLQGDKGDSLYVIEKGSIELSIMSESGRKLSLSNLGPNMVFGEIALFDDGPRTATAIALEPSRLWSVSRMQVLQEIVHRPSLALDMLRMAGERLRQANGQLEDYVFHGLPERLARKVLFLADQGSADGNKIQVTQFALADYLSVSREAVSKVISVWRKKGWIEVHRGVLRVLNPAPLIALARSSK
jgi:CRP/FNR family transcriptional regulator, cyclic AMP receptor protein